MCLRRNKRTIKCLVWDLDNTLWDGVLLEDEYVSLKEGALNLIKILDSRGIMHSIASKNDYNKAMVKLREFGLDEYFIHVRINWNSKSTSLGEIARSINIGVDALAFIDDDPFELEEVSFTYPEVLCINASDFSKVPDMPEMIPCFITEDSKIRRSMYLNDMARREVERCFNGPKSEFLNSLEMVLTISPLVKEDLPRAEELTFRTHQLNTTGYTYSRDELEALISSPGHRLYISSLRDKYGTYGKIGLAVLETGTEVWNVKLLLISCRVISRGVAGVLINHIRNEARKNRVRLLAEFIPTDANEMMHIAYKFNYFKETEKKGNVIILENDLDKPREFPGYFKSIRITDNQVML